VLGSYYLKKPKHEETNRKGSRRQKKRKQREKDKKPKKTVYRSTVGLRMELKKLGSSS
jgi:hypothetical protein